MRVLIHETMTGEPVTELQWSSASWSTGVCQADEVSATLPSYIGQELYSYMIPKKFTVTLAEEDGRVRGAGVLGIPESERDDDGVSHVILPGRGIESIFERRVILPYPYWPLIDSLGYPMTSRDTNISGVQYGTMMKRLYQQAMTHPGSDLPVLFEVDRVGTRQRNWPAVSGTGVQQAVEDISNLQNGVEWDWVPNLDENDRLSWTLITGDDTTGEITSAFWHTWQTGGADPDVRDLKIKISPEFMTQTTIFTGGKDDDRVMVARATGSALIDTGIPLSELWDSSHSSVSVQATLDGWANKAFEEGQAPVQYWSFDVRADRATGLRHGDWCTVEVSDDDIIPDGSYSRRVVSVGGDGVGAWLSVTVAGDMSW